MRDIKKTIMLMTKELKKDNYSNFDALLSYKEIILKKILKDFKENLKGIDLKKATPYNFNNSRSFLKIKISENIFISFLLIRKSNKLEISLKDLSLSLEVGNKIILLTPNKKKLETITFSKDNISYCLIDSGVIKKVYADNEKKWQNIEFFYRNKNKTVNIYNTKDFINVKSKKGDLEEYGIADVKQFNKIFYGIECEILMLMHSGHPVSGIKNIIKNDLNIPTSRINNFISMLNTTLEKEYKYGEKISTKSILTDEKALLDFIELTEMKYSY